MLAFKMFTCNMKQWFISGSTKVCLQSLEANMCKIGASLAYGDRCAAGERLKVFDLKKKAARLTETPCRDNLKHCTFHCNNQRLLPIGRAGKDANNRNPSTMYSLVQPHAWVVLRLPSGTLKILQIVPNT